MAEQKIGISPDKLYQSFTKNVQQIQSGFQLLFDTVIAQQAELDKVRKENSQIKGKAMPKSGTHEPKAKIVIHTKKKKKASR